MTMNFNSITTDHYLIHEHCVQRLVEEYRKHNGLIIGVDFDDTIYDTHHNNYTHNAVIMLLRLAQSLGCTLCVWTANADEERVRSRWTELGLVIDYYNESPVKFHANQTKPYFNLLLDDRAGLSSAVTSLYFTLMTIEKDSNE